VSVTCYAQNRSFDLNRKIISQRPTLLREGLQEAETQGSQSFDLEATYDIEGFDTYVQYVHSGEEALPEFDQDNETFLPLLRLHTVAHKLEDYTVTNRVIDKIIRVSDLTQHLPTLGEIMYVWTWIPYNRDHPLCQLFVDYQIHDMDYDMLLLDENREPFAHYTKAVAIGFSNVVELEGPRGEHNKPFDAFKIPCSCRERCHYHTHTEDHPDCTESVESGDSGACRSQLDTAKHKFAQG
jgi:hypothetical protein